MVISSYTTQADTPKSLSIAILVIYLILIQPVTFVFFRHGIRSWLAWLPLQSLCMLRIVGSALQIHDDTTNTTGGIAVLLITNIGLAPLLLAAVGVVHEARAARNPDLRRRLEQFMMLQFHTIIVAAMVLVVIGLVKLTGSDPTEADTKLPKAGAVIIILCWVALVAGTAASFRPSQYDNQAPAYRSGTKLLYGAVTALPFVGLRELDAVLSNFITSRAFVTSLAVKVCLSTVPEMIVIIIFIAVGLAAYNIKAELKTQRKV